jgi:superfamily II DNA or RNA helicase
MNKYAFQDDAIKNITSAFSDDIKCKGLLVIPTGGGKTLTAIRAIDNLYKNKILSNKDEVLWVVHSKVLKSQTEDVKKEKKWITKFNLSNTCLKNLKIEMITAGKKYISSNSRVKLIIIDEAHHSAAPSYEKFMTNSFGILGLTATPIRHDAKQLSFDKIIFSITFKELIEKKVISEPLFRSYSTNLTFDVDELKEDSAFNTYVRNNFIADKFIIANKTFSKTILYVHTVEHAKELAKQISLKNDEIDDGYELVGYIHGKGNSEKIDNKSFLKKFKKAKKAIVVNCGVLTEGYDDPTVNTIGMCVPTQSIIFYMQCIGRGIRSIDSNDNKSAYIVEFTDILPNIKYRIDNRWLYSDISDELEPEVIDINFNSKDALSSKFKENDYLTSDTKKQILNNKDLEDIGDKNIFMYNPVSSPGSRKWKNIIVSSSNRNEFLKIFNQLSYTVKKWSAFNNTKAIFEDFNIDEVEKIGLKKTIAKTDFKEALLNAFTDKSEKKKVHSIKYLVLNYNDKYPEGLEEFLSDCYNADEILEDFDSMENISEAIIKFPIIYNKRHEAIYVKKEQLKFFNETFKAYDEIMLNQGARKVEIKIKEHVSNLNYILIPIRCLESIPIIIKEHKSINNYIFNLKG